MRTIVDVITIETSRTIFFQTMEVQVTSKQHCLRLSHILRTYCEVLVETMIKSNPPGDITTLSQNVVTLLVVLCNDEILSGFPENPNLMK